MNSHHITIEGDTERNYHQHPNKVHPTVEHHDLTKDLRSRPWEV